MVLVMMSIPTHMMAAGSLYGMERGVHPITTNHGNQVSKLIIQQYCFTIRVSNLIALFN